MVPGERFVTVRFTVTSMIVCRAVRPRVRGGGQPMGMG